jgi:hypothetical protein
MGDLSNVLGSTGLRHQAGRIDEEWHRDLKGDRARKTYQEMSEQDPSCGAVLGLVRAYTLGTSMYVEPVDDTPEAREVVDFVEDCREDMRHTWSNHVAEMLSCCSYGWAMFETVYKRREDGRVGWDRIEIRGQNTLDHWELDKDGTILGMWQLLDGGKKVLIPLEKGILYRVNVSKNNPEGRSLLRAAYRPYYYLKRLQEIEAIGCENDATGIPYLQVPPPLLDSTSDKYDASIVSDLEDKIVQIGKGTRRGLVIGAEEFEGQKTGWKLDTLRGGGRAMYDTSNIILRYRAELVNAILNAGMVYLGQEQHGSYSLADSKTNTFAQALAGLLDDFCDNFTRNAIAPLCELNGIPRELYPYLTHGDIESPNLTEIADYVTKLVGVGIISRTPALEERMREVAHLPSEPMEEGEDWVAPTTGEPAETVTEVEE